MVCVCRNFIALQPTYVYINGFRFYFSLTHPPTYLCSPWKAEYVSLAKRVCFEFCCFTSSPPGHGCMAPCPLLTLMQWRMMWEPSGGSSTNWRSTLERRPVHSAWPRRYVLLPHVQYVSSVRTWNCTICSDVLFSRCTCNIYNDFLFYSIVCVVSGSTFLVDHLFPYDWLILLIGWLIDSL